MKKLMFASLTLLFVPSVFSADTKPVLQRAEIINTTVTPTVRSSRDTIPSLTETTVFTAAPVAVAPVAVAPVAVAPVAAAPVAAAPIAPATPGNATSTTQTNPDGSIQTTTSSTAPTQPPWIAIVMGVLGLIWTQIMWPWVQSYVSNLKSSAQLNQINMGASLLSQKQIVLNQVMAYVAEHALAISQKNFPLLAQDILAGKYRDPHFIQEELNRWLTEIKNDTIAYFNQGGVDVIAVIGDKALVELINAAASRVSPFPGKDIATELLDDKVVPMLLNYGVDWVRKYYLGAHTDAEINLAKSLDHLPAEKTFIMLPRSGAA